MSLELEPRARRAWLDGQPLRLTTVEYDLLACLADGAGRVLSRDHLTSVVLGRPARPGDRSLDVHIAHLRQKLGAGRGLIVTVRGVGYLLQAPS